MVKIHLAKIYVTEVHLAAGHLTECHLEPTQPGGGTRTASTCSDSPDAASVLAQGTHSSRAEAAALEAAWHCCGARGASQRQQWRERVAARASSCVAFNRTRGGRRSERGGGREAARRAGGPRNVPPYIDLDLRRVLLACPLACLCPGLQHTASYSNIGLTAATVLPSSHPPHDAISSIHSRR